MNARALLFVSAAAVSVALLTPPRSLAAGLDVVPSLRLEGVWDSNVFNAASDERSDYVLRARPTLTLGLRALNTTFNLLGAMTSEEYARFEELDKLVVEKSLNFYPTDPVQVNPKLQLRPTAYYFEATDYRRQAFGDPVAGEPETTPGEDVDLTSVSERAEIREYAASLAMTYTPTANVVTEFRGSALRQEHPDAPPAVRDFRTYGVRGSAYYWYTARLQVGPHVRYTGTSYDDGGTVQLYQGSLGARYLISEGQILEARGGASYSRGGAGASESATAPYALLSLDSTWGTFHAVVLGEYGVEQGGIVGVATTRFLGRVLIEKAITPRTTAELIGAYQRSELEVPVASEVVTVHTGSLAIRYLVNRWATIRVGGRYFRQTSDAAAADDLTRSIIFLGVDLSEPFRVL